MHNKKRLGKLNNSKIEQMIKNGHISEPFNLCDIGNYLTTIKINKYKINCKKDNKNLIAIFKRMRKKYLYAYEVNEPLNIYTCISKNQNIYAFEIEEYILDRRIVFTNYLLDDYNRIDLQPQYFEPEILLKCLNSIIRKGISYDIYHTLQSNINYYNVIRNSKLISLSIINQLELRYIFFKNNLQYNPYREEPDIDISKIGISIYYEEYDYINSFETVLKYSGLRNDFFTNKTQKQKPEDGLFNNELNYLKKYLTLAFLYEKYSYLSCVEENNKISDDEYFIYLKEFIASDEAVYTELSKLYYILQVPHKIYDPIDVYSKKYKKIFNSFRTKFSKWQTQRIMKRYLSIVNEMTEPIPYIIIDLVDVFTKTFTKHFLDDTSQFSQYRERILKEVGIDRQKLNILSM